MSNSKYKNSDKWMNVWLKRGLVAVLLWPLSLVFRVIVLLRSWAYSKKIFKSTRLPVPVIVVGNIFIGGTGKTPLVIWLVGILKRSGFLPGVVSRGYGSKNDEPVVVVSTSKSSEVGDEPLLIAQKADCPIVICKNRTKAAQFLLVKNPEINIIISDDGMQHYALQRDIEIMLFDGRGSGNGWMLPAGPLREPLSRRRDFTVVNGNNYPAPGNPIYVDDLYLMKMTNDKAEQLSNRTYQKNLSILQTDDMGKAQRIVAAAGVGNPSRFFASLRVARLSFQELPLPDHFDFSYNPFAMVDADVILITEKDAVKCTQIKEIVLDDRIWVVLAKVEIDNNEFEQRIVEKCREC